MKEYDRKTKDRKNFLRNKKRKERRELLKQEFKELDLDYLFQCRGRNPAHLDKNFKEYYSDWKKNNPHLLNREIKYSNWYIRNFPYRIGKNYE